MKTSQSFPKQGFFYLVPALLLGLTLQNNSSVQAQELIWAKQVIGFGSVNGVAVDGRGNSYVTGSFVGTTIIFGPGETNETTLTSAGENNIFVAKYNPLGTLVWAKQAAGEGPGVNTSAIIAIDSLGNSYVTGGLVGEGTRIVFGPGEPKETTLVSERSTSYFFVAKYAPDGTLVWAKRAGKASGVISRALKVDGLGNSYVTGSFSGDFFPATFGLGEANETSLTPAKGEGDIFLAKYAPNGALIWAKRASGKGGEVVRSIAVDGAGNSYLAGEIFRYTVIFGPGEPNETTLTTVGTTDIFVAKYAPDGTLVWAKRAGGSFDGPTSFNLEGGYGVAVDGSGNSYVTGIIRDEATFGAGEVNETKLMVSEGTSDVFVAKYAPNGGLVWAKGAGGDSVDIGMGIAVDKLGNSYITGSFIDPILGENVKFGEGEPNETTLKAPHNSGFAMFVAKYASNGNLVWAKGVSRSDGIDIGLDGSGNSYVTGGLSGDVTFGLGEPNETTLTSGAFFVAKFSGPPFPPQAPTSSDFDGDGKEDLVWRNSGNGATALWLMNGTSIASFGFPGGVPLIWQIAGVGDVNGDGKADVIWRNTTSGTVAVWVMNGLTITAVGFPGSAPTNWSIQGVGDVNGDGKADLVWRNTADGNTAIWVMNGTTVAASSFPSVVSVSWQIAGVGDVNGDGNADVIWRNGTSGAVAVWVMNGAAIASIGFPGNASTDFKIAGIGDVNGDNKVDLVWHNTSDGNMEIWLLNGKSIASTGTLDGKILVWKIAKVGDVDGDGRSDVIWRNSNTGALDVWLLNGISITSTGSPGAPSPAWELQGSRD
jgi:VCBS repeat protein/beta-propeller repeat-containing protein